MNKYRRARVGVPSIRQDGQQETTSWSLFPDENHCEIRTRYDSISRTIEQWLVCVSEPLYSEPAMVSQCFSLLLKQYVSPLYETPTSTTTCDYVRCRVMIFHTKKEHNFSFLIDELSVLLLKIIIGLVRISFSGVLAVDES